MTLFYALLLFTAPPQAEPEALWQEANQHYKDGSFQLALDIYLILLRDGVENGKLHYNLGNAYFKTEHLGKAILHYNKAAKYLPGDSDVAANLALAEDHRAGPKIEDEHEAFAQTLDRIAHQISYRLVFLAALVFLLIGGLASLLLILRPMSGKWLGYVMVIGATFGLILMALAFVQHRQLSRDDMAVLTAVKVDVRSGPSNQESSSFVIHEGIRCRILDKTEGWFRIGLANGYNGWVPRGVVEII